MIATGVALPVPIDQDRQCTVVTVPPRKASLSAAVGLFPDWQWRLYLSELPERNPDVTAAHVEAVRTFWSTAIGRLGYLPPVPVTEPTSEGAIQLTWDRGRYYLDVEIFPDGRLAWFFKNSETQARAGTDDDVSVRVDDLPHAFVSRLRLVRG